MFSHAQTVNIGATEKVFPKVMYHFSLDSCLDFEKSYVALEIRQIWLKSASTQLLALTLLP